jgi:magnesium transporter
VAIVDNAVYVDGVRLREHTEFNDTLETVRARGGMGWLGLYRPDVEELGLVAAELGLHDLAVEDTLNGHQRAKLDHYGDHSLLVLRPARYIDETEKVEFGELHVYTGADFVVTVRHAESPDLSAVRSRMEAEPDVLALGPRAVLYAILDQVVDEYAPVAEGLANDIDEIDEELFSGNADVSRRIYELSREVIELQRATAPLERILESIRKNLSHPEGFPASPHPGSSVAAGASASPWSEPASSSLPAEPGTQDGPGPDAGHGFLELDRRLADVQDHVIRLCERVDAFRDLLANALSLSSTLNAQRATETGVAQNEQMKKISSWAAILFAPSLIGSIYGMNFHFMPELSWVGGYPLALGLMLGLSVALYFVFKANKWL